MNMSEAQSLLKQAGATIRSLVEENQNLRKESEDHKTLQRIEKIANAMAEKGIGPDDHDDRVAVVKQASSLDAIEEAIKLSAPQGLTLGGPSDQPGNDASAFETFILTGD